MIGNTTKPDIQDYWIEDSLTANDNFIEDTLEQIGNNFTSEKHTRTSLWAGLDIGSTTVKIAVVDPKSRSLVHTAYRRHDTNQAETAYALMAELNELIPESDVHMAICGSGAEPLCKILDCLYVQEVIAAGLAATTFYPSTSSIIELGGQDAKLLLLTKYAHLQTPVVSDMRMNGVCAGGTGAFLDQMALLLHIRPDQLSSLASQGKTIFPVSGRCGVFAKTDVQRLLAGGARKEDIALSVFHAVVTQTVTGLGQGTTIKGPLLMLGGPLAFNAPLRDAFAERLHLKDTEIIIPQHAEVIVAAGAALYAGQNRKSDSVPFSWARLPKMREHSFSSRNRSVEGKKSFFSSPEEKHDFHQRHKLPDFTQYEPKEGETVEAYLGIDSGSTTVKFVLMDDNGNVLYRHYQHSGGESIATLISALKKLALHFSSCKATLKIKGIGSTGYGELLIARALGADYHTVETVSHAAAAIASYPDASFVLDVGGQDMKAIKIENGVVTDIHLNEACSAGCGSFVETFAKSLGIKMEEISTRAFQSFDNSDLGSRCTVFMNSLVTTEQRSGRSSSDIIAGICRSIVENIFTKVIRASDSLRMGNRIIVQGGTFKNDAVLRALEQYLQKPVFRAPYPGEMGALGVALLTKRKMEELALEGPVKSTFIGFDALDKFSAEHLPPDNCSFCPNSCNRTIIKFNDGSLYVTGNRCERGEVLTSIGGPQKKVSHASENDIDLIKLRYDLVFRQNKDKKFVPTRGKIGIPRVLEFYNSFPFWRTLFEGLGFEVSLSQSSNRRQYESGLHLVSSDTICFPAKLVHGHIESLVKMNVDHVFMPMMLELPQWSENPYGTNMCPIVAGYPMVTREMHDSLSIAGIPFHTPLFRFNTLHNRYLQIRNFMTETFGIKEAEIKRAYGEAVNTQKQWIVELKTATRKVIDKIASEGGFAVVVAARPYQYDPFVNHNLSRHFVSRGIPVIPIDALPDLENEDLSKVRPDILNPFHAMVLAGAIYTAKHPNLQMAQVVSFGCGHDAVLTDEMSRQLKQISNKSLLVLKLDESSADGPIRIRIDSFVETISSKPKEAISTDSQIGNPFSPLFTKEDQKLRTILIPNLSPAFTAICRAAIIREGYKAEGLPIADREAIDLGKKYVHNDICFPAQVNIGEALRALQSGEHDPKTTAIAVAKNCRDCRAGQYSVLARKALDDAGFGEVPLVTTGEDTKEMHPGFKLSPFFGLHVLWGITAADSLQDMLLRIRPYEISSGQADSIYNEAIEQIADRIQNGSFSQIIEILDTAITDFNAIPLYQVKRKPRVLVIGEILINYHPTANSRIVEFLENQGMEVILPHMVPFFQKDNVRVKDGAKRSFLKNPLKELANAYIADAAITVVVNVLEKQMTKFKFNSPMQHTESLAKSVSDVIDPSLIVGEGWLIPAEIIAHEKNGIDAAVIIQPFGCLPNQITGKGLLKTLRSRYPELQLLSIDYDPDTSIANIESRLHMLVMASKQKVEGTEGCL